MLFSKFVETACRDEFARNSRAGNGGALRGESAVRFNVLGRLVSESWLYLSFRLHSE